MDKTERKKQEKEFRDFFLHSSVSNMKAGMWVTLTLFLMFRIITLIIFGDSETNGYFLRFGAIIPFIVATLAVLYIRALHKWLQSLLTGINLLVGTAVFFVGATSVIDSPGFQFYDEWVMLVIIGTFVFYRILLRNLLIIGGTIILSFVLANIFNQLVFVNPLKFTIDIFFAFAIGSLGYFLSVYRNKIFRTIYMKEKESLEQNRLLKSEIQERQKAQVELDSSQKVLQDALNAIPDPIHVVDSDFNIVFFNNAFTALNRELNLITDVIGKNMFTVFPFLSKTQVDEMNHVFNNGEELITEEKTDINGKLFYTETRKIPVFKNKEVVQVMTIIRDISRKAEIENLKQKNIEQKEILLREIHHRVKNNLAIVISLLDMQVRNNPNPEFIELSKEIEYRIRSMSLIHEHLYKSDELDRIALDQYLISISHGVTRSYGSKDIRVVFDCERIDTNIELAMPLGLIVTELLTNACKYSYPDKNGGEISVSLKREISEPNLCRISIRDKGVGLPEGFSLDDPKSMGLLIIKLLSKQIAAKLVIENHNGTSFSIIFKGFRSNNQS